MDFVHDQLAMGGKIRILTPLDTYRRYAHAVDAREQYRAENVVATLESICARAGSILMESLVSGWPALNPCLRM